jgi:Transposase DDE domain group 1
MTAGGGCPRRTGSNCSTSAGYRLRDTGTAATRSRSPGSRPTTPNGSDRGEPGARRRARRVRRAARRNGPAATPAPRCGPTQPPRRPAAVHRPRRPPVHGLCHQHTRRPAGRPGTTPPAAARCEDRIRNAKDTGLRNLPLHGYAQNQIWCEIAALACELLARTATLALPGPARRWELRRLPLRIFSCAGRIVRGSRRLRLRLAVGWP